MPRYAFEIFRGQSAEGFIRAETPEKAKEILLEEAYDLDWESDFPEVSGIYEVQHEHGRDFEYE